MNVLGETFLEHLPFDQLLTSPVRVINRACTGLVEESECDPLTFEKCLGGIIKNDEFYVYDNIYGSFTITPLQKFFIDHPLFTRLQNVSQLGALTAVRRIQGHNRYHHCIGTMYVVSRITEHLVKLGPENHGISKEAAICAQLSALCHDLGHGPNSHMFEDALATHLREMKDKDADYPDVIIDHEYRSILLFKAIFKDAVSKKVPGAKSITKEMERVIMAGIDLDCYLKYFAPETKEDSISKNYPGLPSWANAIIGITSHTIGADRIDYLARDSYWLQGNIPEEIGSNNIWNIYNRTRIIDGKWAFDLRDQHNIERIVDLRNFMFIHYYNGRDSNSISLTYLSILSDMGTLARPIFEAVLPDKAKGITAKDKLTIRKYYKNGWCKLTDDNVLNILEYIATRENNQQLRERVDGYPSVLERIKAVRQGQPLCYPIENTIAIPNTSDSKNVFILPARSTKSWETSKNVVFYCSSPSGIILVDAQTVKIGTMYVMQKIEG